MTDLADARCEIRWTEARDRVGQLRLETPDAPSFEVWDDPETLALRLALEAAGKVLRGEPVRYQRETSYGYVHLAPEDRLLRCYGDDVIDVRLPLLTSCHALIGAGEAYFRVATVEEAMWPYVNPALEEARRSIEVTRPTLVVEVEETIGNVTCTVTARQR